jgi:hypothetical protein
MRKHTPKHLDPQPHLEELLDQAVLAAGIKQAHRTSRELSCLQALLVACTMHNMYRMAK